MSTGCGSSTAEAPWDLPSCLAGGTFGSHASGASLGGTLLRTAMAPSA